MECQLLQPQALEGENGWQPAKETSGPVNSTHSHKQKCWRGHIHTRREIMASLKEFCAELQGLAVERPIPLVDVYKKAL